MIFDDTSSRVSMLRSMLLERISLLLEWWHGEVAKCENTHSSIMGSDQSDVGRWPLLKKYFI